MFRLRVRLQSPPTKSTRRRPHSPLPFAPPQLKVLSQRSTYAAPPTAGRPFPPRLEIPHLPSTTMVSATSAALAALFAAFKAMELFPFLELLSRSGTSTSTWADSTFDDAMVKVLLALAAMAALFGAVAFIHLHHAAAAAFGAGNKRLSELVLFVFCGAAGVLQFIFFVQPVGAVDDVGALARALGRAALEGLPASATVVFVLGITLVIAHIRAGGEGGGGGAAVADNRRVPAPLDVLKKIALGAAAALLTQFAMAALYVK